MTNNEMFVFFLGNNGTMNTKKKEKVSPELA